MADGQVNGTWNSRTLLNTLEGRSPAPVAPAVHGDKLWDADKLPGGVLTNVDPEPIPATDMTKREYFALLNARGLRLKDQQESTTGPEVDLEALAKKEAAEVAARNIIIAPRPFSKRDAEIFQAHEAVLARYGLIETLGCDICWQAGRVSGCKTRVDSHGVRVECRCGVREYRAPVGTTDQTLTFTAPVDTTTGTVMGVNGEPQSVPALILTREHADVIRAYRYLLSVRKLSRSLFCRICSLGQYRLDTAVHESVTEDQVTYVCRCRIRFCAT
jgi:hypothetical protein